MTDHDHRRTDPASQRAVLALARAVLSGDPGAAAEAVRAAPCGQCLAVGTMQLGYALCGALTGDTAPVSEQLRRRIAYALTVAEQELGSAGN